MEKITKINDLLDQLIELKTQDRDSPSVIVEKRRKNVIDKLMRLTESESKTPHFHEN